MTDENHDQIEGLQAGVRIFTELLDIARSEGGGKELGERIAQLDEDELRWALFGTVYGVVTVHQVVADRLEAAAINAAQMKPTLN